MMKKKTVRLICLLLALLMVGTIVLPLVTHAAPSVSELQQKLNEIKKNLSSIQNETDRQEANKKTLNQQNEIIRQQIIVLDDGMTAARTALAEKQADLDQKKRDIDQTDALFQQRLRAMYVMHNSGVLSTILGVNSFEELLTASTTMSRISISDTELLAKMAKEREQIEADEKYINERIAELEAEMAQKENKKNELVQNLKLADKNLTDLEAQEQAASAEYAQTLQQYNEARAQTNNELGQGSSTEFVGGQFAWPVPGFYNISSGFGSRTLYGKPDFHTGIDIAQSGQIYGAPVVASLAGTVQVVKYGSTGYGYYVIIDHGGNYKTLYGHLSGITVTAGQPVTQGQTIGYVGSTGNSTGPHLHFEIRVAGEKVDPLPYVRG